MIRFLILITLFSGISSAQSISFRVLTTDGDPLSYAVVRSSNAQNWAISDEDGFLKLNDAFAKYDSLIIERLGYHSKYMKFSEMANFKVIVLAPDPISLDGIISRGQQSELSMKHFNAPLPFLNQSSSQSFRHYFSQVPGVSVKSYGGPGSINTLSMNGGSASNSKILVDGFDLTNTQNGEMDLSQLPLPFIQRARLVQNEVSMHGSGSSDGVIYLEPWWNQTGLTISSGSFGHRSASGMVFVQKPGLIARILAGSREDKGDFPVSWKDLSFPRQNNDFHQNFGGLQYSQMPSRHLFIKILALITDQERGVPGPVWSPSNARRNDQLLFAGATIGMIRPQNTIRLKLLGKSSTETFKDVWYGIESDHKIQSYSATLSQDFILERIGKVKTLTGIQNDNLISSDAGSRSRVTASNSILINKKFNQTGSASLSNRVELEKGSSPVTTWGSTLTFLPDKFQIESVGLKIETGFRRPSFNELYWNPGGNPNLLAEKNISVSGIVGTRLTQQSNFSLSGFYTSSSNLIQWLPYVSFWRPVNISRSERSGVKGMLNLVFQDGKVTSALSATYINTINRSEGSNKGKALRYVPNTTLFIQVNWHLGELVVSGDMKHTGKIISNYDWPEDIYLPSVTVGNMSIHYTWSTIIGKLITSLSIENLNDVQYQSMMGYPEMGRSIRITQKWEQK